LTDDDSDDDDDDDVDDDDDDDDNYYYYDYDDDDDVDFGYFALEFHIEGNVSKELCSFVTRLTVGKYMCLQVTIYTYTVVQC